MIREHVLLTTDVVGGVWDFSLVLADGLRVAERTVTLLALGSPTSIQRRAAVKTGAHVISCPLKLEWMQDSAEDVEATRRIVADVVREVRADAVHANQFAAACADVDVPVLLTLHSDVLSWRRWTLGLEDVPEEWRAYTALVRQALSRADAVVAVSRFLANEFGSLYGTDRAIEVVHNGWPPPPASTSLRKRITLVAGRAWDLAKNISLVAEAAHGWNYGHVYLAGETNHPDGGRASIPPPLLPLGFLPWTEMSQWLQRAAVYVSPARYDPFGLLPLQAALHGCALLLSDIPSYRELWIGAAVFFRSNDAADLRRQWQSLMNDPQRLAGVQAACRTRAVTRYTAAAMVDRYRELYANLHTKVPA